MRTTPSSRARVKSSNPRTWLRRRVVRSLLLFVLGLVVLIVGVAVNRPALTVSFGIVGFALMLFAALRGAADLRRLGGRPEAAAGRDPVSSQAGQGAVHGAGRGALASALGRARPLSSAPAGQPGEPSHHCGDHPVARVQGIRHQRRHPGS